MNLSKSAQAVQRTLNEKGSIAHVLIDEDLMLFSTCWAAAGTPHAVFCLTPEDLIQLTDGNVVNVKI